MRREFYKHQRFTFVGIGTTRVLGLLGVRLQDQVTK